MHTALGVALGVSLCAAAAGLARVVRRRDLCVAVLLVLSAGVFHAAWSLLAFLASSPRPALYVAAVAGLTAAAVAALRRLPSLPPAAPRRPGG